MGHPERMKRLWDIPYGKQSCLWLAGKKNWGNKIDLSLLIARAQEVIVIIFRRDNFTWSAVIKGNSMRRNICVHRKIALYSYGDRLGCPFRRILYTRRTHESNKMIGNRYNRIQINRLDLVLSHSLSSAIYCFGYCVKIYGGSAGCFDNDLRTIISQERFYLTY